MKVSSLVSSVLNIIVKMALLCIVVIFVYKYSLKAYDFGYRVFAEPAVSSGTGTEITVAIVEGKSTMEIGEILEEKGLIRDAKVFYAQEMLSEYHGFLRPGIYTFSTAMTINEMLAEMADLEAMEAAKAAEKAVEKNSK